MKISDFNFSTNTFIVHGKGDKERVSYLNNSTKKALLKYLEIRKSLTPAPKDEDYLFLTRYNKKITILSIQKAIKKAYKKASINEEYYSAHTLRHTCATLLYKAGIDIRLIKKVLGHVKIDTTEIYTHLHDEEVIKAMQYHPLSCFKMQDALCYCA